MRVILWLVAALAVLWCGYWFLAARTLRTETLAALATMKAEGRADYSDVALGGFPARFELTVTDPAFRDPDRGLAWRAPRATVHALAYDPSRIIAVLPSDQVLGIAGQTIALTTTDMRASAAFGRSADLPLQHAEAITDRTTAQSANGWSITAAQVRLATRAEDFTAFRYRLGAEGTGLTLSGLPAEILGRAGLGNGPGRIRLDAGASFDGPLDRNAVQAPPRTTEIDVRALELDWGALSLRGNGTLSVDPDGVPKGTLTLSVRNWQGLPPLMVAAGLVPADMETRLAATMAQLARLSGKPDELTLPLAFQAGWVALGPLPLGPAPRL